MKIRFTWWCVLCFITLIGRPLLSQGQNYTLKYDLYLKAPDKLLALSEDLLAVYDHANSDYQVYLLDLQNEEVVSKVLTGRGPGELHRLMYKTMMHGPNETISVFDRALLRTNLYDRDLNFVKTLMLPNMERSIMQAGFIDDSTIFRVTSGENFLSAYPFKDGDSTIETSPLWELKNTENENFAPLENFLLKQDIIFEQDEDALFLGFTYGSLLAKISREGIVYFTTEPQNHLLPDEEPENGRIYSLPDIGSYPICTLDIDVQGEYVYVLYSGKKISNANIFSRMFNFDKALEQIEHSNQIFKFDKESGEFIERLTLPIQANNVEFTEEYLYVMSFINEDVPTIYKYPVGILVPDTK